MAPSLRLCLPLFPLLLCSACSFVGGEPIGLLYTDVTLPYSLDMNKTPNPSSTQSSKASRQRLSEPITGLDIRVEVESTAFGDAIKNGEIRTIYYADIRRQSVLLGLWQKDTVILRGE